MIDKYQKETLIRTANFQLTDLNRSKADITNLCKWVKKSQKIKRGCSQMMSIKFWFVVTFHCAKVSIVGENFPHVVTLVASPLWIPLELIFWAEFFIFFAKLFQTSYPLKLKRRHYLWTAPPFTIAEEEVYRIEK